MLKPEEYIAWQQRLDNARRQRRADMGGVWPTPDDSGIGVPIEIAPGRGNLDRPMAGGAGLPGVPTSLSLIGNRTVSFARIFQSQPWVATSVYWLLKHAIRVPLRTYWYSDTDPNDRREVLRGEHPFADAIRAPWPKGGPIDLILAHLAPVLVHGNAVTWIDNGAGNSIQFVPQDWRFCRPTMPWRGELAGFTFNIDYPEHSFHADVADVLHLTHYWSPNPLIGTSPLQQLGVTLRIEDAAQRYQQALFANGARPPSAITAAKEFLGLDRQERDEIMGQLREDITNIYAGPENQGHPALLPPGLDWKVVGGSVVEAALVEQRKVTREEIAAVYGIPPPLEGILDRATYANIQSQRDMTYTDVLGPPLIMFESAINSQVIRDVLKDDRIYVAFDFSAVLRGDRLQEIEWLRGAIGTAMMTPNESRGVLGLPKVDQDGMDEFYLPLVNNLQALGGPDVQDQGTTVEPFTVPETAPGRGMAPSNGHHASAEHRRLVVASAYKQKTRT